MTAPRNVHILVVSLGRRGGVTDYGWLMARALSRYANVAAVCSAYAENSDKWLTWMSRGRADGYVLLSRSLRDDFVAQRRLDPARVMVIPHGVLDDYPSVSGGPTQLAARMGIPDAEIGTYVLPNRWPSRRSPDGRSSSTHGCRMPPWPGSSPRRASWCWPICRPRRAGASRWHRRSGFPIAAAAGGLVEQVVEGETGFLSTRRRGSAARRPRPGRFDE